MINTSLFLQRIVIYRMQSPMPHRHPADFVKKRQLSASLGASLSNVKPLEESTESGIRNARLYYSTMICVWIHYAC